MSTTATLCNDGNTGSLTITIPAAEAAVLINEIELNPNTGNPNVFQWVNI